MTWPLAGCSGNDASSQGDADDDGTEDPTADADADADADEQGEGLPPICDDHVPDADEPPTCYEGCAADVDPGTPGLQASCEVSLLVPGAPPQTVTACTASGGIPDGAFFCFSLRADEALHLDCLCAGANLEVVLVVAEGLGLDPAATLSISCTDSSAPASDCPNR